MRRSRIVAFALAVTAAVGGVASFAAPAASADTSTLPADPARHGWVGFCDERGRTITGGSVTAKPFVWKAVASEAPPAQYRGTGENAVLTIYQPRPGIPPNQWSGVPVTAASFYSTPTHPAVQSTYRDESLADFRSAFPTMVKGLYVVRMGFGKADFGLYSTTYPTTTIQVSGNRWRVVDGGSVDCAAAKAVSDEALTGSATADEIRPRTGPSAGSAAGQASGSADRADSAGYTTVSSTGSGSGAASPIVQKIQNVSADGRTAASSSGSRHTLLITVLAAVLALIVLIGVALVRRRSSARTS